MPKYPTLRRLHVFIIMLVLLLVVFALGATSPLEESEAMQLMEEVKKILPEEPNIPTILINNLMIALIMLIPGYGMVIGVRVLYDTGLVFSAFSTSTNTSVMLLLFSVILMPFFWLEFFAYAATMTQNLHMITGLIRFGHAATMTQNLHMITGLIRRKIRGELRQLLLVIALSATLLFAGAAIEVLIINLFQ